MSETFKAGSGKQARYKAPEPKGDEDSSLLIMAIIAFVVIWIFSDFFKKLFGQGTSAAAGTQQYPSRNRDQFRSLAEVKEALRKTGLESSNLIVGIDFTKSNTWTGKQTFGGHCLHDVSRKDVENPYQKVIRIISKTLHAYDEDSLVPVFGFGDIHTQEKKCFPFFPDRPCRGLTEILSRYNEIVRGIELSGPTNFAPIINKAIEIVKQTRDYHILVIIADGQVDRAQETVQAIVSASNHPLSIVCVGVGDGPWDMMEKFDDQIPQRRFDNFQFVNMRALEAAFAGAGVERLETEFACAALMELPEQFATIRRLGLL